MSAPSPVTIIIPVYDAPAEVEACIASVLRHATTTTTPAELLVIDDASPDPAVAAFLGTVATDGRPMPVTVLRNETNAGFVATVNRGLRQCAGDAVILNADTVVTAGWLDHLAKAASGPDVATVTPLTNFGSLATLPRPIIDRFGLDSDVPLIDECGAFVDAHGPGFVPQVISGVGFCMYVTRTALDDAGLLDEATFGRGYGEEVDFCLRAGRLGYRHLIADTAFVYHRGGGSFGDEREPRRAAASRLLHKRYPFFRSANAHERADAPLAGSFLALEMGLADRDDTRPHVLQILHGPPFAVGGTEKHLHALLDALGDEFDFSILYPIESAFVLQTVWRRDDGSCTNHRYLLPGANRWITTVDDHIAGVALTNVLDLFHFDAVHVQNLIGHSLAPLAVLDDFEGTVVCSVRDLFLACPHYSLLYRNAQPCGIPDDLAVCARCLPDTEGLTIDDLHDFRATVTEHLDAVDHWVVASQSAADYILRAYPIPEHRIDLIEHGTIIDTGRRRVFDEGLILDEPLRLAFVGRGWTKKGLPLVNALADSFADSSIEIHHFGGLVDEPSPNLVLHGPYDNEILPDLLHLAGIQIVLLPGMFAETFGHVMTESLVAGLPVMGVGYGALGERIRRFGVGWTIDPTDAEAVRTVIESLDRCRAEVVRATRRVLEVGFETVAQTAPRYAALYRSPAQTPESPVPARSPDA